VLDVGGGLGIDYTRSDTKYPTPFELVDAVREIIQQRALTLIVEPGRSLVADAGALVTTVLGVKRNGERRFIVSDGAMTENIRPCLYSAHHTVVPTTPQGQELE